MEQSPLTSFYIKIEKWFHSQAFEYDDQTGGRRHNLSLIAEGSDSTWERDLRVRGPGVRFGFSGASVPATIEFVVTDEYKIAEADAPHIPLMRSGPLQSYSGRLVYEDYDKLELGGIRARVSVPEQTMAELLIRHRHGSSLPDHISLTATGTNLQGNWIIANAWDISEVGFLYIIDFELTFPVIETRHDQ